ncbi:MAG TPA: hypothetical protein VFH61_06300 [Thermoleophilia bacterium]|nr:hypothetical protein [Thermoleophilia bacterium]
MSDIKQWYRAMGFDRSAKATIIEDMLAERLDAERSNARHREIRDRLADAEVQLSETMRELRQIHRREDYLLATERQLRGIIEELSSQCRGAKDVDTQAMAQRHRERLADVLGGE